MIVNINEHPFKLESDSTLREDIRKLKEGDESKANEEKIKLEIIQRNDRKLRNDYELKYKIVKVK